MALEDYIRTYDYTLSDDVCKNTIKMYEELDEVEDWDRNGRPQFTQFNLTQYQRKKIIIRS